MAKVHPSIANLTLAQIKAMIGNRERYKAKNFDEYHDGDDSRRRWLIYCEQTNQETIYDCIEILEKLHDSYTTYHERTALRNAIRHLEVYLNF